MFHGKAGGFWVWLFTRWRPGFQHCFVALMEGPCWTILDPCRDRLIVNGETAPEADLPGHYRAMGYRVVETELPTGWRSYPVPFFFTCVEAVKRVLGIHGWWIWTPYQLYRYLEQAHGSR